MTGTTFLDHSFHKNLLFLNLSTLFHSKLILPLSVKINFTNHHLLDENLKFLVNLKSSRSYTEMYLSKTFLEGHFCTLRMMTTFKKLGSRQISIRCCHSIKSWLTIWSITSWLWKNSALIFQQCVYFMVKSNF